MQAPAQAVILLLHHDKIKESETLLWETQGQASGENLSDSVSMGGAWSQAGLLLGLWSCLL